MISQTFNIINGKYINNLSHWIVQNGGKIKSVKIDYPTGDDAFYGELSIISEMVGLLELGGLAGEITFSFKDDQTLSISFYGSLPLKSGCYRSIEIDLRGDTAFDKAIDTLADEIKEYVEHNANTDKEQGGSENEPF